MKKFTTKLLMSIIAVAFAFVALGTSTYAWFAMNNSVTVSGLNITAKSNSIYLLVGTGEDQDTASEIQDITPAATKVNFNLTGDATKVYPAAHNTLADADAAATLANWYYKVADVPTASASAGDAQPLPAFTNYVIQKTVYITLAQDSIDANNLKVSATFAQGSVGEGTGTHTYNPVKVVIATEEKVVELSAASRNAQNVVESADVLAATVTDDDVIKVDIYLYYDGNHNDVYTTNFANLDGSAVSLAFSVDSNN